MRVLLVQPYTFTIRGLPQIPLALMYLGGHAEKKGHTVRILDRNLETHARRIIDEFRPDVVGVTSLTGKMILDGIQVSRYVRGRFPKTKIVWGGIHASTLPEVTLQEDFVDFLVIGEGEESFVELLSAIENNEEVDAIPGIAHKSGDRAHINPRRPFMKDLDAISFVPWHLIDPKRYLRQETLFITSRGCPHRCAFCYNETFNRRKWRAMSPERVKAEIEHARDCHPIRRFRFDDDNFCVDRNRFHRILDFLPRDVPLYFESRVDYIDEEFCRHVAEFRDAFVFLGIESGDDAMLKRMQKDITVDQIRNAYALINRYKIRTSGSFVIGSPGETGESLRNTLSLLEEIKPTRPSCCIFVPFPGSLFTQELMARGELPNLRTLRDWGTFTDSEYAGGKQYSEIPNDELNRIYSRFWWRFVWNFASELRIGWILAGILNAGTNYWRSFLRTLRGIFPAGENGCFRQHTSTWETMSLSSRKILLLKCLASAVLTVWILSRVDITKLTDAVCGMSLITLMTALSLYLCTIAVSALRWHLLIPHRRYADLLPLTLIAQYYAMISPGQIAGEAVKAYRLGKGSEDAEQIVAAVIIDRIAGVWGILILALIGLKSGSHSASPWGEILLLTGLGVLAAASLLLRFMAGARFLQGILSFMAGMGRKPARLAEQCGRLLHAWKGYMGHSPRLFRALLMGIGYQGLGVLISQILAKGIGIDLPFSDWCWIFGVVSLLVFLPLTIGGIGLREGGLILLLGDLGVPYEKALGLSLSIFALQLFGALLGAVVDLLWGLRKSSTRVGP